MRMRSRILGIVLTVPLAIGTVAAGPAPDAVGGPANSARVTSSISPKAELKRMSFAQRVGQMVMVGTPATHVSNTTKRAVRKYHVGSVFLSGTDDHGIAAHKHGAKNLQSLATKKATAGSPLYIAVDQEGGFVQTLDGKAFGNIPRALTQGTWYNSTIKKRATTWGTKLKRAGVNLNLAPVMDTVTKHLNRKNKPIGFYYREFAHKPHRVAMKGTAFANGMRAAGVQTAIKHFPGLGRVRHNTDTASGVRDHVTTRHGRTVKPFKVGVKAGTQFVMISSAYYNKIDKAHPGPFSKKIIRRMLRHDLGFNGVVISDDLGQAKQMQRWPLRKRALKFVHAGGNMILTVKPQQAKTITRSIIKWSKSHPVMHKQVNRSALKVLQAKHRAGLDP